MGPTGNSGVPGSTGYTGFPGVTGPTGARGTCLKTVQEAQLLLR